MPKFFSFPACIIDNTQIVFIRKSLNDFILVVNIITAPQIILSTEFSHGKCRPLGVSHQIWQISGGKVAVAQDVERKDNDRSTTQCDQDCDRLEVRVNLNQVAVGF